MRWRRVAQAVGLGMGLAAGLPGLPGFGGLGMPAAGADCSGPTIEYDAGPVDPGQEITVIGTAFGDNCYDTGPPPAGEGLLGRPLAEIDVVITQASVEHVVAEGSAGDDYGFRVDVTVPTGLAPGEARLQVRWGPGTTWAFDGTDQPLAVSDTAATGSDRTVIFGPEAGAGPSESPSRASGGGQSDGSRGSDGRDRSGGWTEPGRWIVAALVVTAGLGVGSMVVVRRH